MAGREERTELFRRDVEADLLSCSEWLGRNAADLSRTIAGGCRDWEISFASGEDGMFTKVHIAVNKIDVDAIEHHGGR